MYKMTQFRGCFSILLLAAVLVLSGCAGSGQSGASAARAVSVDEDEWTEVRELYHYRVYSPGLSQEQMWWSDMDGYQEARFIAGRFRANSDIDINGRVVARGTEGVGLYIKDGYDLNFYLPPVYRKIVPVSPSVAYAQPVNSDTFLRIDLSSGEQTATPYTQVDTVVWSGNSGQRNTFPFFLAEPEPGSSELMRVTLLDINLQPAATFSRVPYGRQQDYLGQTLSDVRYMSTRTPGETGSYVVAGLTAGGETVHRFADIMGHPVSPDLRGVATFNVGNSVKLGVEVEPGVYHPVSDTGVAINPLPPGVIGYKPLVRDDGRPSRWAVKWETRSGPRWSVHQGFNVPWRNGDLEADAYYTDVVAIPSLPGGRAGVACAAEDGTWDVLHDFGVWELAAPTSGQAIARAERIARDEIAAETAAFNAAIEERKRRQEEARRQAEAERAARVQALVSQFNNARQSGNNGAMFDAAIVLGGQYFVEYVVASGTNNSADIQNAIRLSNDSNVQAQLRQRLNSIQGSYTPQSGWGSLTDQMLENSEQAYQRDLQWYLRGGSPSNPRVYNLYD